MVGVGRLDSLTGLTPRQGELPSRRKAPPRESNVDFTPHRMIAEALADWVVTCSYLSRVINDLASH